MVIAGRVLLILIGTALLATFLLHFSGIPRIEAELTIPLKEAAAGKIQLYQLLLIFPGVVLLTAGLASGKKTSAILYQLSRKIICLDRKWFIIILFCLSTIGSAFLSYYYLYASPQIIDSQNYYFQARVFNEGRTWVPSKPYMEKFFGFLAIMDTNGRRYGSSFPGHPFILGIGEFIGFPWMVNPVQGGLIVVMVYLLGTLLFPEPVARLAGLLSLISPFRMFQCSLYMAHPTATLWILIFLWVLFHYIRQPHFLIAILIGVIASFLYMTRPQSAAPILLPFGLYYIWLVIKRAVPGKQILCMAVPLILAILASFCYNKMLTGEYFVSPRDIASPTLRLGFGDDMGRPVGQGEYSGHSLSNGLRYTRDNLKLFVRESLCWGGWTVLFILPAIFIALPGRSYVIMILSSGLLLMTLFVAYPINSQLFGARYYFEWLPLYLLMIALGIWRTKEWIENKFDNITHFVKVIRSSCILSFLLFFITTSIFIFPSQLDKYYNEIYPNTLKQATEEAGITSGIIFYRGNYFTQSYAFVMNDPLLKNKLLYAYDNGDKVNKELKDIFTDLPFFRYVDPPKGKKPQPPVPYSLDP